MFEQVSGEQRLSIAPSVAVPSSERDDNLAASSAVAPASIVTLTIIAINVIVFLCMMFKGVSPTSPTGRDVIPWGANFGPLTMTGQWWRLFTGCFVHFGIVHIGMNMYILFQVGLFTEALFGRVRFILLYLLAGLSGSITSLYIHPYSVSAGASGAIFGVYGALLAFLLVERKTMPGNAAGKMALRAAFFLVINLAYGIADSKIDLSAHLGGFVMGFVAGCVLARPHASGRRRLPLGRTIAAAVGGMAILAAGFIFLPKLNGEKAAWFRSVMAGTAVPAGSGGFIVYAGKATRAEAEKLSKALDKYGMFNKPGHVVLLSHDATGASISTVIGKDESTYRAVHGNTSKLVNGQTVVYPYETPAPPFPWNDPGVINDFRRIGISAAPQVGGVPIKVLLLNSDGELRRTIVIDQQEMQVGKLDRIWFSGTATSNDAIALGMALLRSGFFRDQGGLVLLSRGAAGTELSFLVKDGSWEKPTMNSTFAELTRKLAGSIGGLPITVHFVNSSLEQKETFVVR